MINDLASAYPKSESNHIKGCSSRPPTLVQRGLHLAPKLMEVDGHPNGKFVPEHRAGG